MRNRLVFGLALIFVVPCLAFAQANLAGKWTGEMQGRGGNPQPVTLELTVSGTTVTGKLTQGQGMPVDIQNAKSDGTTLTFSAPGGGGGGRGGGALFNYTAKVSGGEMTVTREAPAPPAGAPAAGAPPAGGGAPGGGGGRGGGGPVTFTLKKA